MTMVLKWRFIRETCFSVALVKGMELKLKKKRLR